MILISPGPDVRKTLVRSTETKYGHGPSCLGPGTVVFKTRPRPETVVKILQVVIVHVVELQAVTSYNVNRSQNVLVALQHVQLQVTTGKTGKNSSKT